MTPPDEDCGCCAGTAVDTPVSRSNPPGLPAVGYRVGTYADFRSTLRARLSSTDFPALGALSSREPDDWTIALADGFACVADVLSFYQQRIANESWLRTATERRSVLELARLIGYQLAPGVAAGTVLAFTLESSPGLKAMAARPVTIATGSKVQSVPDADQSPQTFETTADITARVEWNAIPAQTGETIVIASGLTELYVAGTGNALQPGDALLIVGRERLQDPGSERWDVRWLDTVEVDAARNVTRVAWSVGLGDAFGAPASQGLHVYVFRQRAALFGSSAPDPNLVWNANNQNLFDGTVPNAQWKNFSVDTSGQLALDASYPKVVRHSWVALTGGDHGAAPTGYVELYRVEAVSQGPRTAFGLSAKVTQIQTDSVEHLSLFHLRTAQVLAQSEELQRAQRPLRYPVFGSTLTLGRRDALLQPGQALAISGKRQRVQLPADTTGLAFDDGRTPQAADSYPLAAAPQALNAASEWVPLEPQDLDPGLSPTGTWRWSLLDADGTSVVLTGPAGSLLLQAALDDDDTVSEAATLVKGADGIELGPATTRVALTAALVNCYDRTTVAVNANVAPATHGESVAEIGGSGDAAQANQRFVLKQSPLTWVSSASEPGGAASTLQVRVGDVLWTGRPTLYGSGPAERVFSRSEDDDGKTSVQFGDGVQGARLPSAQNNVRFAYRKGLGEAGNLRSGQLSTLLSRPLGVRSVTNPVPATGGQDAEKLTDARGNAPLRVLTLDRAVSAQDYADFSRAFAGIAKASALWINNGRARGVYVTVAGSDGGAIEQGSATQVNLVAALREYGDALLPLSVRSHGDARFSLSATVKVDPAYESEKVIAAVEAALRAAYAFDARAFGQPVGIDEAYAVIQGVAGVVASDIQQLYRVDTGPVDPQPAARLFAALPVVQADGSVNAAELLTLDDGPLSLGVMT